MQFYSQRKQLYSTDRMGNTNRRIMDDGCTMTCLSMIAEKNPGDVNHLLSTQGGYWYDAANKRWTNLISWVSACNIINNLRFIRRDRAYDNQKALDAIAKYGFVLAEVDFDGNPKTTGRHWIVLLGNKRMYDPWSVSKHPESTSKYKEYTGLAVVEKL